MDIYSALKTALRYQAQEHGLAGQQVNVRCKALSAIEAIGNPQHDDYPIVKGREVMVEARFKDAKGQAFTDHFEQADYTVEDILGLSLDTNRARASFIAGLNAIYRYLNLCDRTVHCKDDEPRQCALNLSSIFDAGQKILLVGFQPRFLEMLTSISQVRVLDLDPDNIGKTVSGVLIEPPEKTQAAMSWCDAIFATGSTLVNGTITTFLTQNKPVWFYGVSISAAAQILGLKTYCHLGH